MSAIFINGKISLEGRDACFENGSPTNMPYWEFFKNIDERLMGGPIEVTQDFIEKCFNKIIDGFTGTTLRSKMEMFEKFCEENDLIFRERPDVRTFIIAYQWQIELFNEYRKKGLM